MEQEQNRNENSFSFSAQSVVQHLRHTFVELACSCVLMVFLFERTVFNINCCKCFENKCWTLFGRFQLRFARLPILKFRCRVPTYCMTRSEFNALCSVTVFLFRDGIFGFGWRHFLWFVNLSKVQGGDGIFPKWRYKNTVIPVPSWKKYCQLTVFSK